MIGAANIFNGSHNLVTSNQPKYIHVYTSRYTYHPFAQPGLHERLLRIPQKMKETSGTLGK